MKARFAALLIVSMMVVWACEEDIPVILPSVNEDLKSPTPFEFDLPRYVPPPDIPADNPMTVEGIALGRKLFYDPILSGDFTQSCGSCHNQEYGFSDNGRQFSVGIDGIEGDKNSMALINLAWGKEFFWDHRSPTLEQQAEEPVPNIIEMNLDWETAINRLQTHEEYPDLFEKAFLTDRITVDLTTKALAQFMRSLVSFNAPFDNWVFKGGTVVPTEDERVGSELFVEDPDFNTLGRGGDCNHCHSLDNGLFTDNLLHNNGLEDAAGVVGTGAGAIPGSEDPTRFGWFKTPTLRNIAVTGPYMHDGRFKTLREVLEHYGKGLKDSGNNDPLLKFVHAGGVELTEEEIRQLLAFLHTLTDEEFLTNPDFAKP